MTMGMTKRGLSGGDVDAKIATHSGNSSGVHGAGISNLATTSDISTHAALATGVHGAGPSTIATTANIATHAGLATGVHNVGASTIASAADITTHAGITTGIHGVAGSTIASAADITTHAGVTTGIHGVGGSTIASAADITTHAGVTTGIHGVGGSTIASVSDITTHAGLTNNVHGAGLNNFVYSNNAALTNDRTPLNHGSDKHTVAYDAAGAATAAVDGHKDLATGVHGAGINNFVYSDNAALTNARTPLSHGSDKHTATYGYVNPTATVKTGGTAGTDCDFITINTALASGAKTVFVRAGTYTENPTIGQVGTEVVLEAGVTINGKFTINANNCTLRGAGTSSLINGGITGSAVIVLKNDILVENIAVQTTAGGGTSYNGVDIGDWHIGGCNPTRVRINNVTVNSSDNYGIYTTASNTSAELIIENCHVLDSDSDGFNIDVSFWAVLSNCISVSAGNDGFAINGSYYLRISNCLAKSATGYGFSLVGSEWYFTLNGCVIDTTGNDGIFIENSCRYGTVVGCSLKDWTGESIDNDSATTILRSNSANGTELTAVELTENKGAVSGYCGLDAGQKVATANLGGAGADNTKYLRGDQTWQVVAAGGTDILTVWAFGS